MQFKEIRAQEAAVNTFKRAIASNKLHHAYLFSGPPGVGKMLAAKALAMTLNCLEQGTDACGVCIGCRKVEKACHPDVITLTLPDGKKLIPIESVRELGRRLAVQPHEGRASVAIIDPADKMSLPASNALLKTLEEPRLGSFLFLISSRASSLLATVRSRCQPVHFRPLPEEVIADLLQSQGVGSDEARLVAALCQGSMEQALLYLSEDLDERIDLLFQFLEGALDATPQKGLEMTTRIGSKRESVLALLDMLTIVFGEMLWLRTHIEDAENRVLVQRFGDRLAELSKTVSVADIALYVAAASRAVNEIQQNNMNPQLALEGMLLSMRGQVDEGLKGSGFGVL